MVMVGVCTDVRGFVGEIVVTNLIKENVTLPNDAEIMVGYSPNFCKNYKIKSWRGGKKSAKVRIWGVDNEKQASDLMEKGIFVEEDKLKESNPDATFVHDLIGMKVVDHIDNSEIGQVSDLMYLPANDVLVIDMGNKLLNIPLVEDFVVEINSSEKIIRIILPEGYEELTEMKK